MNTAPLLINTLAAAHGRNERELIPLAQRLARLDVLGVDGERHARTHAAEPRIPLRQRVARRTRRRAVREIQLGRAEPGGVGEGGEEANTYAHCTVRSAPGW